MLVDIVADRYRIACTGNYIVSGYSKQTYSHANHKRGTKVLYNTRETLYITWEGRKVTLISGIWTLEEGLRLLTEPPSAIQLRYCWKWMNGEALAIMDGFRCNGKEAFHHIK